MKKPNGAKAGLLDPSEVHPDDDVTEDDAASGFELFCAGWDACYRHEMTVLRQDAIASMEFAHEDVRPIFRGVFRVLGLDWLFEFPEWLSSYKETGEDAFIAWRRIHPRHPTSPNIRP